MEVRLTHSGGPTVLIDEIAATLERAAPVVRWIPIGTAVEIDV